MRLYLVRHGQTSGNVRMALDTAPPGPPLTEQGRQEAAALAGEFAGLAEPVAAVYASTALRAQQTAAPLAAALGTEVVVLDGVHEVSAGELEGRNDHDALRTFRDVYARWLGGSPEARVPGGESALDALGRFLPAVRAIRERHPGAAAVLVSHGGIIRLAGPALAPNVAPALAEHALLPNTGMVVLDSVAGNDAGQRPAGSGGAAGGWHCVRWTGVQLG